MTSELKAHSSPRGLSRKVALIRRFYKMVIEETRDVVTEPLGPNPPFDFRFRRALAKLGPEAVEAWLQGESDGGYRDRTVHLLSLAGNLSFDRNGKALLMLADSFRFDARQARRPYWSNQLLVFRALVRVLKGRRIGPALERQLKDAEPWHQHTLGEWLLELTDPAKLARLKQGAPQSGGKPSQTVAGDRSDSRLRKDAMTSDAKAHSRRRGVSRKVALIRRFYEMVIEETEDMVTGPLGPDPPFFLRFHRALAKLGPDAVEAWLQGEIDGGARRNRTVLLLSHASNISLGRDAEALGRDAEALGRDAEALGRDAEALLMLADSFRFDARQARPYRSKELLVFRALVRILKGRRIGSVLERQLKDAEPWHELWLGEWLLELTDPAKLERLKQRSLRRLKQVKRLP